MSMVEKIGSAGPAIGRDGLVGLRSRIRALERGIGSARSMALGVPAIDAALPGGGLPLGVLHEILGTGADEEDGAIAAAFAAGILGLLWRRGGGRILWCVAGRRDGAAESCFPDLYGPGLLAHGLPPEALILARCRDDAEILWSMEEGLRSGALAGVLGEIGQFPAIAGRRLQLACEAGGVTGFALRRWRNGAIAARQRVLPSVAVTRWRISAAPSRNEPGRNEAGRNELGMGGSIVGMPFWTAELLRCRGGRPAAWHMPAWSVQATIEDPRTIEAQAIPISTEKENAADSLALSARLADRPAATGDPLRRAG